MNPSFATSLKSALEKGLDKQRLAQEFEVTMTTVDHWADGVSVPHPIIQSQVLSYIEKVL